MSNNREWFLSLQKRLEQQPQIKRIFNQLVFGVTGLCMLKGSMILPVTLYLYESVPQILVVVDQSNQQKFFDIRNSIIYPNSYKYEMMDKRLTQKSYLLLKHQRQEVVVIFPHQDERATFIQFFRFYSKELRKIPPQIDTLLLSFFTLIDTNQSSTLSDNEITQMLSYLKLGKREHLMKLIDFVREEQNSEGELSFRQFQRVMMLMECRPQIKHLYQHKTATKLKSFRSYTEAKMTKDNFGQFLRSQQGEKQEEINRLTAAMFREKEMISFHNFCGYIFSQHNDAYCAAMEEENVDMKQPLTSYYCMSSHNTYLTGNQLTSDSRTQRYLQDLEAGYRCVEIDVHNGEKGPIVKHGFTITSAITFQEVISAIANFSNTHRNHTPIILSLQNHTSSDQQRQMASILKKHFDKKLLIIKEENLSYFPKMEECLGKIIIKNSGTFELFKKASSQADEQLFAQEEHSQDDEEIIQNVRQNYSNIAEYSPQISHMIEGFQIYCTDLERQKATFGKNVSFISSVMKNNFIVEIKEFKIVPELISITSMLGSGSLQRPCIWESISLSEGKILKHYQNHSNTIKNHTERYWIRGYPSGGRVDSSNYDPLPALEQGVQLIAINSQNADQYSMLMRQFFRRGSKKCKGYRLKPDPHSIKLSSLGIKIRPISGFMLSQDQESGQIPTVSVQMAFLGGDEDMRKNSKYTQLLPYTEEVKNNAYNPVFENSKTLSLQIYRLELAFLVIDVPRCGKTVLPLDAIRKGYRCINLTDSSFCQKGSFILLKFD